MTRGQPVKESISAKGRALASAKSRAVGLRQVSGGIV